MSEENVDQLKLRHLTGRKLFAFPPIFSPDSSLLFVASDKVILIFSTSTGQPTRTLEGANEPLIGFSFDLKDKNILVACTQKGEIIHWKWATGSILCRVEIMLNNIRFQTFNLISYFGENSNTCAFVTGTRGSDPYKFYIVNSENGAVMNNRLDLRMRRQHPLVDVDNNLYKYVAFAQAATITILDYKTWKWDKFTNANNASVTCLRVHPSENTIATGDEMGRVTLWWNFFQGAGKHYKTHFHWHHTSITSVAFSLTGSSFYSSGWESVLVRWNVSRPDKREFMPRMPAVIRHIAISPDNSQISVSFVDNGIQILDVSLRPKCTLQEFTYIFDDKTQVDRFPVRLRVNPRKNTLVLNGRIGHLQFYSTYTKNLLYNMDVVNQNQLSMEDNKILYNVRVTQAAFNIDWMVTVEIYNDEEHIPEVRLKFWEYNDKEQRYTLNTNVDLPHEGGVKAVEFSNPYQTDNLLCATVGEDNLIKIWALEDSYNIHKNTRVWFCRGQTKYKHFGVKSIAFSQDGSLLAAGCGNSLCIYKAATLKLVTALHASGSSDGCLNKAQINIPKTRKNGSKKDIDVRRENVMQMFLNQLQNDEDTLVKHLKSKLNVRKIQQLPRLNELQKKQLYNRIKSTNNLNLFQKLLIYQKLGISLHMAEGWHKTMFGYIHERLPGDLKHKNISKTIPCLNLKHRFKAKYKFAKYIKKKTRYDKEVIARLQPLSHIYKENGGDKPRLPNGVCNQSDDDEQEVSEKGDDTISSALQSVAEIKSVHFCFGDFAHLVLVCTENRILIWNLLTLRLHSVLKVSTQSICIDPQTNMIAVFTKNSELHVFLPSVALPIYFRANMPRTIGAVWLPRQYPRSQALVVNWQARSNLYFLTDDHAIMHLCTDDDLEESSMSFASSSEPPSLHTSILGMLPTKHINNVKTTKTSDQGVVIGVHGKDALKSILELPTYTMAPLSLFCHDFLKDLNNLKSTSAAKESNKQIMNKDLTTHDGSSSEDEDYVNVIRSKKVLPIPEKVLIENDTKREQCLRKVASEIVDIEF